MAGLPGVWGQDGRGAQHPPDEHTWRDITLGLNHIPDRESDVNRRWGP